MDDKSEWETFLVANIPNITITTSLQKRVEKNFSALEELNKEKKGFAVQLEEALKGLAPHSLIGLEEHPFEDNEEITKTIYFVPWVQLP